MLRTHEHPPLAATSELDRLAARERPRRQLRYWAIASILTVTIAQLAFLAVHCDWDLCGDEAEYWAWSRRLDWSYYAKGPLIALVIRIGTAVFGPASLALCGSLMPAVRLPAVILGALTAWGVFRLVSETCRNERAALLAVLLLPAVPLFRLGGLLMTIDTPLVCCWTWAAVWSFRALAHDDRRGWPAASLLVALGVLAKYTMLAFPASVGLFLLAAPAYRRHLLRPGFWLLSLGCALGMLPIVAWNAQHRWVGAGQMADRVGLLSSGNWGRIVPLLSFLGGEVAVFGLWWVFAVAALATAVRQLWRQPGPAAVQAGTRIVRRDGFDADRSGLLYLVCLWAVIWSACVSVSLLGETEANWAAPAHVSALALVAWWIDGRMARARSPRRLAWGFGGLWIAAILFLSLLQHTEWLYPALARFVPQPTAELPAPLRKYDPTCRFRGYRELVPEVERRLAALRAEGLDPFVLTPTYTLASTLTFYLPGHPEVYCLSWSPGMTAEALNQHDLWRPNPRRDIPLFRGRPAVVVDDANQLNYAKGIVRLGLFASAEPTGRIDVRRGGPVVAAWNLTTCRDYQGPEDPAVIRPLLARYTADAYFASQGGTNEQLLRGLYRDLLGRPISAHELSSWTTILAGQPRVNVVARLLSSDESRRYRRR